MIPIKGLFEAHISVRHFERSVAFYRDVHGLELGIAQPERPAAFFWVGGRGRSMMGIFSAGSSPFTAMQHLVAFQVELEDVLAAPQRLRSVGITPLGGQREPIDEPIVFLGCPPHPYSSTTRMETYWSISPCFLIRRGLSRDRCP
jgi:lactoylglutathione lyase